MKNKLINFLNLNFIWLPILLYLGDRSYIAQDEGYYALQAKWILERGQWISPMWWNETSFDRTATIQSLIAISQKLFGENIFAAHLPSLLSAVICLLFTNGLSKELNINRWIWLPSIILVSTYLWVNNAHLATQDMAFLMLEVIGLYCLVKYEKTEISKYAFISGLTIGPAISIKTGMVVVPIISIMPYILFCNRKILRCRYLYYGILTGVTPLLIWVINSINLYGFNQISGIINKIKYLSDAETYSKSSLYYLWNIPINTFPWSFLSIYGMTKIYNSKDSRNILLLIIYPIVVFILLSLFKTKTSYYALQITPFIALTSAYGIEYMLEKPRQLNVIKNIIFTFGLFILISTIYINNKHLYIDNDKSIIIYSCLLTLSTTWLLVKSVKNKINAIALFILGPYLCFFLLVQSGQFSNRDKATKDLFKHGELTLTIKERNQLLFYESELNNEEFSRLVKIGLYSPNTIKRVSIFENIRENQLVWIKDIKNNNTKQLKVLYRHPKLAPWVLTIKD